MFLKLLGSQALPGHLSGCLLRVAACRLSEHSLTVTPTRGEQFFTRESRRASGKTLKLEGLPGVCTVILSALGAFRTPSPAHARTCSRATLPESVSSTPHLMVSWAPPIPDFFTSLGLSSKTALLEVRSSLTMWSQDPQHSHILCKQKLAWW